MDTQELLQIRQRMKELKLSGAALARRLGHSPSWVNSCLNGHYPNCYAGERGKASLPRDIERALRELRIIDDGQTHEGQASEVAPDGDEISEPPLNDRALTLWQPYGSLLLAALKTYETRSWPLSKPGWIAVHAAKSEPPEVHQLIAQPRRCFAYCLQQMGTTFEELPRGAVIGLAHFGPPMRVEEVRMTIGALDADFGNWTDGRWAWPVLDIWPFPEPVPARGMQGIWRWNMPPDLSDAFAQHWLGSQRRVRR